MNDDNDSDFEGKHMPEERTTGSKIGLDLSAGSTRVYTAHESFMLPIKMEQYIPHKHSTHDTPSKTELQ